MVKRGDYLQERVFYIHTLHHPLDGRAACTANRGEWIYVLDGEVEFEIGKKRFRLGAGESVFIPRKVEPE